MKKIGMRVSGTGKLAAILLAVLAVVWVLSGCSANNSAKRSDSGAQAVSSSNAADRATGSASAASESKLLSKAAVTPAQSDAAGTAFGPGTAALPEAGGEDGLSRKIVYKANMTMQVENYAKAQSALQNLIQLSDGYMLQFSDQKTATELGGTYTIKVPASGFSGFIAQLEKIEHLDFQSSVKGTDVTEEYVDLESRLKARQVVEARLLSFMEKATKADDLLKFSQELGSVQTEIEQIKGRMRYLDQNVAYSTVEIRLYQEVEPSPNVKKKGEEPAFTARLSTAMTDSALFLYRLFQGVVVVIAAAIPVAAVIAIIGTPFYIVYRKRRAGRGATGIGERVQQHAAVPAIEPQSGEPVIRSEQEPAPPADRKD